MANTTEYNHYYYLGHQDELKEKHSKWNKKFWQWLKKQGKYRYGLKIYTKK